MSQNSTSNVCPAQSLRQVNRFSMNLRCTQFYWLHIWKKKYMFKFEWTQFMKTAFNCTTPWNEFMMTWSINLKFQVIQVVFKIIGFQRALLLTCSFQYFYKMFLVLFWKLRKCILISAHSRPVVPDDLLTAGTTCFINLYSLFI